MLSQTDHVLDIELQRVSWFLLFNKINPKKDYVNELMNVIHYSSQDRTHSQPAIIKPHHSKATGAIEPFWQHKKLESGIYFPQTGNPSQAKNWIVLKRGSDENGCRVYWRLYGM